MTELTRREKAIAAYNAKVAEINESKAELVIIEAEEQILKIIDWAIQQDEYYGKLKIKCEHETRSYSQAQNTIYKNEFNPANWLRAVERIVKEYEKYPQKLAVIQRFPKVKNATEKDKSDWLFSMNIQIAAYIGNDVELVYKKKSDRQRRT